MTAGTDSHPEATIAPSWLERLTARASARVGPGAIRGALSILDQLVVSGSHFVAMVIVGRACGPEQLGDYTLAFTVLTIAICIQQGLISLPYTIYSNYLKGEAVRQFSGSTLALFGMLAMLVATVLGLTCGAAALGFGPSGLVTFVAVLAVVFPAVLFAEFARGFSIARLEMTTVLAIDIVTSLVRIGGLLLLASLARLSAEGAFVALGVGAATAGLGWFAMGWKSFSIRWANLWADAKQCWNYGSWFVVSQLILAARASALLWILVGILGSVWTGVFAACDTIVRLSNPAIIGIRNMLYPTAARAFAKRDLDEVRRLVLQSAQLLFLFTALAGVFFALFGNLLISRLYGAEFSGYGTIVTLLALGIVADALDAAAASGLVAVERPNVSFVCNVVGTVIVLALSAGLVLRFGILGAAWGSLIGRLVQTVLQWVTFFWLLRRFELEEQP
jgi:O-antigen/teichoic acid export membrane protein